MGVCRFSADLHGDTPKAADVVSVLGRIKLDANRKIGQSL